MTRREIFEELYESIMKELVFCISDELLKSSQSEVLKEKIFELLQRVAKGYGRENLDEFKTEKEILKEVAFQTIVIYTFFLLFIPDLISYLEAKNSTLIGNIKDLQKTLH